jgi:MinD superfamily P-loop ATPase
MSKLKKIAVTGGKGGTGKSTVSVMMANKLRAEGKKVVLVDLDVECPNDYLLLGQKFKKPVKRILANFPVLDKEKCKKCGKCVSQCRSNAIFQAPGKFPIFIHELCSCCGLCWHICPYGAVKVEKKLIGEVFENKISDDFWLVTGRSFGVVDETGPIVTKTREYVDNLVKKIKADCVLFDSAVGLHCGVIRALIEADIALAVTEPTPLGAHDLKLILDLLKVLKVPKKIIVNQFDLGDFSLVEKISKEEKTEIAYKIPYSKDLVKSYAKGNLKDFNIFKKDFRL